MSSAFFAINAFVLKQMFLNVLFFASACSFIIKITQAVRASNIHVCTLVHNTHYLCNPSGFYNCPLEDSSWESYPALIIMICAHYVLIMGSWSLMSSTGTAVWQSVFPSLSLHAGKGSLEIKLTIFLSFHHSLHLLPSFSPSVPRVFSSQHWHGRGVELVIPERRRHSP